MQKSYFSVQTAATIITEINQ